MKEIDVWTAANQLIQMFHDDALNWATKRVQSLSADGDEDGATNMARIARAIEILQGADPNGPE